MLDTITDGAREPLTLALCQAYARRYGSYFPTRRILITIDEDAAVIPVPSAEATKGSTVT